MRKTNVMIVVAGLNIGGLEVVIANLCRHLDRAKFDVSICCLKVIGSIGRELIAEGYSVHALEKPRGLRNNYVSWLQLLALTRKLGTQVLHSHSPDSLLDVSLCKLFRRRLRVIHTFHYGNYPNRVRQDLRIERIFSRVPDALVAVGDEQKGKIARTFDLPMESLTTIWNGVPTRRESLPSCLPASVRARQRPIIGTACTLIEQKGLTYLLDVAHLLKQRGRQATFVVAGEGHLRGELEQKRSRLGLDDDVVLLGWVDNAGTSFIPYVDIFLLPSLWEAMSVVVLEAMEAGKPVVVTNVGENDRVIEHGVDGWVVEPRDVKSMAAILERLVDDQDLRARAGARAQAKARTQFSVERMVAAYEMLYEEGAVRAPRAPRW